MAAFQITQHNGHPHQASQSQQVQEENAQDYPWNWSESWPYTIRRGRTAEDPASCSPGLSDIGTPKQT